MEVIKASPRLMLSLFNGLDGIVCLKVVAMASSNVLFCLESCIHIATFVRAGGRK